ncbi:hypothetical protein PUN28_001079 [Cardiocondyla obscurior]|uniref:Uncharacterized protein n=1 Tax=Cardiocondyla obscurior TaxID=286306 RepID=A0AAW2H2U1_9HYME
MRWCIIEKSVKRPRHRWPRRARRKTHPRTRVHSCSSALVGRYFELFSSSKSCPHSLARENALNTGASKSVAKFIYTGVYVSCLCK